MDEITRRWWSKVMQCDASSNDALLQARLQLVDVKGLFYMLLIFMAFALVWIAGGDWSWGSGSGIWD